MKNMKKLFVSLLLLVGLSACSTPNAAPYRDLSDNNKLVTAVSLDQTGEVVLEMGGELLVNPTITYKDGKEVEVDVIWNSNRPKVATVNDKGLVTAVGGGSAIITFIAGYKSANFTVTVNSDEPVTPPSPANTLELSTYSRTMTKGSTYQLVATVKGEEGQEISYVSDNPSVATVSPGGLITAAGEGNATITVSCGELTARCVISVPEEGHEEEEDDYDFTVFFFIDYNNIDENDETQTKLLAKFGWYHNEPIANSGKVPANPTQALDPAFPYFVGWSTHTIIDTKDDLCDLSTYVVENAHFLFIYGIWSDVEVLTR